MNKTHYRKVFKSDHLGAADLEEFQEEGKRLVFTIKEVKQELGARVAGKKGNFNIAYFKEGIKPLVLNATNSKQVRKFANLSPYVEDWKNIVVELYIDNKVKFGSDIVSGVRIKPEQPKIDRQKLTPDSTKWEKAVEFVADGNPAGDIRKKYDITNDDLERLKFDADELNKGGENENS